MEYIVTIMLEDAVANANMENRVRVTVNDLEVSVRKDKNLNYIMTKNNLYFLGGGFLPHIYDNIKYDKNNVRTNVSYQIEKYQKMNDCLMFARHPFEKLVRKVVSAKNKEIKLSSNVLLVIQYYTEQWLIELLQKSNNLANYNNRLKVLHTDIDMVMKIKNH
jgi:histone H3/H4